MTLKLTIYITGELYVRCSTLRCFSTLRLALKMAFLLRWSPSQLAGWVGPVESFTSKHGYPRSSSYPSSHPSHLATLAEELLKLMKSQRNIRPAAWRRSHGTPEVMGPPVFPVEKTPRFLKQVDLNDRMEDLFSPRIPQVDWSHGSHGSQPSRKNV